MFRRLYADLFNLVSLLTFASIIGIDADINSVYITRLAKFYLFEFVSILLLVRLLKCVLCLLTYKIKVAFLRNAQVYLTRRNICTRRTLHY